MHAHRRHLDAIQQLARAEWPAYECPDHGLGDSVFTQVGTFHTLADGTIVADKPEATP